MAHVTREQSIAWVGDDRYTAWGEDEAKADMAAKGITPGSGGGGGDSGGGGGGSDVNEFVRLMAELVGSPVTLPPVQVDSIEEYEARALEELRPYYERILAEEGGDVDKAIRRLGEDYERGLRIQREDYDVARGQYGPAMAPGETAAQYYNRTKDEYGTFPTEGISLLGELNKRGILQSGIAETRAKKLQTAQSLRQQALDRAIKRYQEQAGIDKERATEDIETAWARRQFELGEEKKEKAGTLARSKRTDDVTTQEIERENILRKAVQNIYG